MIDQPIPVEFAEEKPIRIPLNEIGTSGLKETSGFVSEAYNARLFWPQVSPEFNRIRTSTPPIVMCARQFQAWARAIKPIVNLPENPTDDDKRYQEFRESDYENMEGGLGQYLETLVSRVPFDGWYSWNVVYGLRDPSWTPPPYTDYSGKSWPDDWRSEADDGLLGVRRLAARDNSSFHRWDFDGAQRMIGWFQRDPRTGAEYRMDKKKILHHTFGDPTNPEGTAGLIPCWRLERLQYGLQVVSGIAAEHAAGYLKFTKTEKGDISTQSERLIGQAAKYMLTAQEGNYAVLPYGFDAELIETSLQGFPALTEAIKNYDVLMLSVFGMQWMALNTLTGTGSYAAQTDVTQSGITSFNSMMDGFASQWDTQVERRIYEANKASFPGMTKRPRVTFSHLENSVPLSEIAQFFSQMKGILPLGEDDMKAIRKAIDFLPDNSPKPEDVIQPDGGTESTPPAEMPQDGSVPPDAQPATNTRNAIQKALSFFSGRNSQ